MRLLNLQQFGRRVDIHATYPTGMQGNDDDLRACFLQRRNGRDQFHVLEAVCRQDRNPLPSKFLCRVHLVVLWPLR